ncbi:MULTISPECIES: hypothetical protein [unclassified Sphingobium]|uniref:hypothetical protein n=1 Tax=unclassified Sphingobium TaxID=2611147 RepID=UPI00191B1EF6|nr:MULTISPECIES: hypothetical protein [unclassified Sphingobium]CAD7336082.1 hypothetical protein SPHS6_00832 [Sphingobium sp. S6]CAD7336145.1 hypothetical protein SPHS8_00872 [Sphingobium sp. S8]
MTVNLDALRREAGGPGEERVLVTRRFLAALVNQLDAKVVLDVDPSIMSGRPTR